MNEHQKNKPLKDEERASQSTRETKGETEAPTSYLVNLEFKIALI